MSTIALTHLPSPRMNDCIRTFAEHESIDVARVAAQHEAYRAALTDAGADVRVLDVNAAHPDSVFIEDTAIVLDEIAIVTAMGARARRDEPRAIEAELRRHRERVLRIQLPATIEGGDVVRVGKTLFVGCTARTNAEGIAALASIVRPLGYDVVSVPVRGCLHLKTACTALPDGALLVNRAWLPRVDVFGPLELVDVAAEEPHAANVVSVDGCAIASASYLRTAEIVGRHARSVLRVELDELGKADGCGTCLSLLFSA